jgi:aminopeptidase N
VLEQFFSDLLLPHEVAHQWWGNMVTTAEYRSAWIMEALANDAALQFLESTAGQTAAVSVLNRYRTDLLTDHAGKAVDSYGPLEFGVRLMDSADRAVWHTITYEKGTWVIQMLRQRLGQENFLKLEVRLLQQFADRPLTNDEFRKTASEFVPAGQPDKTLSSFFETWIYGTGIPKLEMKGQEVIVSGVDDDFTADVPLHCHGKRAPAGSTRWVRLSSGSNSLDLPAGTGCELPPPSEFLYAPGNGSANQ